MTMSLCSFPSSFQMSSILSMTFCIFWLNWCHWIGHFKRLREGRAPEVNYAIRIMLAFLHRAYKWYSMEMGHCLFEKSELACFRKWGGIDRIVIMWYYFCASRCVFSAGLKCMRVLHVRYFIDAQKLFICQWVELWIRWSHLKHSNYGVNESMTALKKFRVAHLMHFVAFCNATFILLHLCTAASIRSSFC